MDNLINTCSNYNKNKNKNNANDSLFAILFPEVIENPMIKEQFIEKFINLLEINKNNLLLIISCNLLCDDMNIYNLIKKYEINNINIDISLSHQQCEFIKNMDFAEDQYVINTMGEEEEDDDILSHEMDNKNKKREANDRAGYF